MISIVIGFFGALLIGLTMGLLGGGGSILAVPIFVYLFGLDEMTATAYSLFVVGVSSIAGTYSYFERKLIDLKTVLFFGLPATVSVFANRYYVLPNIPEVLYDGGFQITKGMMVMVLFSVLMLASSLSMLFKKSDESKLSAENKDQNLIKVIFTGVGVGFVTSIVGAGGGFLIVPAIVSLMNLPVKQAIGTSLSIIMLNSLIGFTGDVSHIVIDWPFIIKFSGLSIVGIFVGSHFSRKISGKKLKRAFGWFVLVMGTWILIKETILIS